VRGYLDSGRGSAAAGSNHASTLACISPRSEIASFHAAALGLSTFPVRADAAIECCELRFRGRHQMV
jgi:hypothetical protein